MNDSISGWFIDRAKNWTTQLHQLLMQSSRYCAARLRLLSLTSQMPVSFDLFDVFQWRAGGGHCVHLEPFSRLTDAHSLTAVINTIGLSVNVNYPAGLVLATAVSHQHCRCSYSITCHQSVEPCIQSNACSVCQTLCVAQTPGPR